jgi:hypothetical protein
MNIIRRALILSASIVWATTASLAGADESATFSGTVESIDRDRGAIVITEIGEGRGADGGNVVTRHTLSVTPTTPLLAVRPGTPPSGFPGGYVEEPVTIADLAPGDFVTVRPGGAIVVVRPERR